MKNQITKPDTPILGNSNSATGPQISSLEERRAAIERLKTFGKGMAFPSVGWRSVSCSMRRDRKDCPAAAMVVKKYCTNPGRKSSRDGWPLFFPARNIPAKERAVAYFIEVAGRQFQDRLRRVFLACGEETAIQFEKQDSDHEARALVAVDKGMVAYDACRITGPL
jgi:hypothetical protein